MVRSNLRNSICRAGDSADSGSSKMKMPWRWQRSAKKRRKPSPCECERKSAVGLPTASRYRATVKKALGAEEPAVGDLRQPARAQRLRQLAAHLFQRLRMVDRHVALAAARLVVAGKRGDAFERRRFAGTVLADDDGDGMLEGEIEPVAQERQAERIGLRVG